MAENIQPWPQSRQGYRPGSPNPQRMSYPGFPQPAATNPQGMNELTREERQEAKRLAEEANFNFSGYQVVRREFISHRFDPAMTIRGNIYSVPDQSRRTQARDKTLRGGSP